MSRSQAQTVSAIPETPLQIFQRTSIRELQLSRLLIFFISGGLFFMLLPGTFLGVWNLISISGRRAADSISPAWIQAHGHAQVLGWIGSFILGIGYYSIPKLRGGIKPFALGLAWFSGTLWMAGVLLRWTANVYLWHWRVLLPVSAAMELAAFLIFFRAVSQHKPQDSGKAKLETWVLVVIVGTLGLLATLVLNLGACLWLAFRSNGPAFPPNFDQRFLILAAWGFMVPFVWGFNAKWLPVFLGARPPHNRLLGAAVAVSSGRDCFRTRWLLPGHHRLIIRFASLLAMIALHIFALPEKAAKTQGYPWQLPHLCAECLRVATDCSWARRLGRKCDRSIRHLGSFSSRADRRVCRNDGILHRSAGTACIFRNATTIQPRAYVRRSSLFVSGMHGARRC